MSIAENIRLLRTWKSISQEELAKVAEVSDGSVSNWENGINEPRMGAIQRIVDYYSLKKSDIIEDGGINRAIESERHGDIFSIPGILPIEVKKIPLLGEVACGELRYAGEDFEGYVKCGAHIQADFALRARGDSMMNARIYDGDIVFIHQQSIVESGEIAAILIEDEASLKRFYRYDNLIVLRAENPDFEDIVVRVGEDVNIRILGKAIAFQSNVV